MTYDVLGDITRQNENSEFILHSENYEPTFNVYNSGKYLYSISSKGDILEINKYEQNGTLISNKVVDDFDERSTRTNINISYVDEENQKIYFTYADFDKGLKVVVLEEDSSISEILYLDLASKFNENVSIPRLVKIEMVDNQFRLTVGTYVYGKYEHFGIYVVYFNSMGEISSEYLYNSEPSMYFTYTLNIAYENDNVYVISNVIDNNFKSQLATNYSNSNDVIRIDQLNKEFEVEEIFYLESEELGDYSLHFKVDKEGDKYTLYSNMNSIEFIVYPKEKLKIVNRELTRFAIIFIVVGVLVILFKKIRVLLKLLE